MKRGKNLLFDDYTLIVSPKLATYIGLNEAIFIQQLHYWLINPRTGKKDKNNITWIYNTYSDWQKNFPFWSKRTIIRIINKLAKANLIIIKRVNVNNITHLEYTINYEELESLCELKDDSDYIENNDEGMTTCQYPMTDCQYPMTTCHGGDDNLSWGGDNNNENISVENNISNEEPSRIDKKSATTKTTQRLQTNTNTNIINSNSDKSELLFPDGDERFLELEKFAYKQFNIKRTKSYATRNELYRVYKLHDTEKLKEIIKWASIIGWNYGKTVAHLDKLANKWNKEIDKNTKKKDVDIMDYARQWGIKV